MATQASRSRWGFAPRVRAAVLGCLATLGCVSGHPAPTAEARAPSIDAGAVTRLSEGWLEALDHHSHAQVADALEPAFIKFEEGRFLDGPFLLSALDAARAEAPASRRWLSTRVFLQPAAAVFFGESLRHLPADAGHPAADVDGWDALVWVPDAGRWKLASWQWQPGGLEAERARWNRIYREEVGFNLAPNRLLMEAVRELPPGDALYLAMGQGRNALYLASHGWRVTGVDISDAGIEKAREVASREHLSLTMVQADMHTWAFGTRRWDLVTFLYAGDDRDVLEKIKSSLKPGGLVVIEFFHKDATVRTGIGGFSEGELARRFGPGFEVLRDEVVEDVADWGQRRTKLVRFVARKKP